VISFHLLWRFSYLGIKFVKFYKLRDKIQKKIKGKNLQHYEILGEEKNIIESNKYYTINMSLRHI